MSFTCPVCGRISYHPEDERNGWCNACHGATGHEPPPGFRWVMFRGGALDGVGRMMQAGYVELGSKYTAVVEGDRYHYNGSEFVLEGILLWPPM